MDGRNDAAIEVLLEQLIEHGPGDMATVFGRAFELAMQKEWEAHLTHLDFKSLECDGDET